MRFGIFIPPFNEFAEPAPMVRLARSAEAAGWDGFFLWDHMLAGEGVPVADPWIMMTAIATATERIRFGALVTPLPRRRPWVLARQVATLDHVSDGRLVLGIGNGGDGWDEFSSFGEPTDARLRGEMLDESLAVLQGLLGGEPVDYDAKHFSVHTIGFVPTPVQAPVPIWAACRWPNRLPLRRAARLQGCFPIFSTPEPPPPPDPEDIGAIRSELLSAGADPDIDIVVRCSLSLEDPASVAETVAALADAGVTWILEGFGRGEPPPEITEKVVSAGPSAG
jgi:alkanesulfonate monooxygenase SsuD/methylene tetrahydromethanopterin reductase-like flavin-dependent oxidoreductase (luciferase family)